MQTRMEILFFVETCLIGQWHKTKLKKVGILSNRGLINGLVGESEPPRMDFFSFCGGYRQSWSIFVRVLVELGTNLLSLTDGDNDDAWSSNGGLTRKWKRSEEYGVMSFSYRN